MQALEYPGFSELDPDFGWHTESRVFSPKKTGTNAFGTWSGRNFSSDYLETGQNPRKGKKGKKWYKFAFTKRSDQKSKGSENRGYKSDSEYMVSQVPLTRSLDEDNYASLSRRRIKSENDVKADYLLTDDSQGSVMLVPCSAILYWILWCLETLLKTSMTMECVLYLFTRRSGKHLYLVIIVS